MDCIRDWVWSCELYGQIYVIDMIDMKDILFIFTACMLSCSQIQTKPKVVGTELSRSTEVSLKIYNIK